MSTDRCFPPEDAARVAALAADSPERRHAADCPRCAALLSAFAAYEAADPAGVPARDLADANARLSAALAQEIGDLEEEPAPAPRAIRAAPRELPWFLRPALRPAFALAALLLAVGTFAWLRPGHDGGAPELRGGGRAAPEIAQADFAADSLRLAWHGMPGADAYEVRFYSSELAELGNAGPTADSSLALGASVLGFSVPPGETVLVRVIALGQGAPLGTSPTRAIVRGAAAH